MRKIFLAMLTVLLASACSEDSLAPQNDTLMLDDAAMMAYGAMDMADPGSHFIARLNSLPDSIKLTAAQETQIRGLVTAFLAATAADRTALNAIHAEARAAREAGKSRAEVEAIYARGHEIRVRLHAAEAKLHADLKAVLTPAQLAWLSAPRENACRAEALRLTDAQKTEIAALVSAFETANRADLLVIKAAFEAAGVARRNGATRQQIAEILAAVRAPMERIKAAQHALHTAIDAVLTPAQRASGCFGPRRS